MRDTLKKYSPKRENVNLGWLNKHLHDPLLWKWNKQTISKAFAIGLFCAFMPIPFHTILAAVLAVVFSSNILLSIALVWVNTQSLWCQFITTHISWALTLLAWSWTLTLYLLWNIYSKI